MSTLLAIFIGFWAFTFFFGGAYVGSMLWIMGQAGIQNGKDKKKPESNKFAWQLSLLFVGLVGGGILIGSYLWSWAKYFWYLA